MTTVLAVLIGMATSALLTGPPAAPWGYNGHEMAARAAAETLPSEMPSFFLDANAQLAWLGPEPDRWRDRRRPAMDRAWTYDHYIDFENVPDGALDARDRFTFLAALYATAPAEGRLEKPERDAGFLPYRIVELYERLVAARPPHWSPLEHVATPTSPGERPPGNLRGWAQLRHTVVEY